MFPKLPSWPLTLPLLRVPSESKILKELLYNIKENWAILFSKAKEKNWEGCCLPTGIHYAGDFNVDLVGFTDSD